MSHFSSALLLCPEHFFFFKQKTKQAEQVHRGPEAEVHPARSAGR